MSTVNEKMTAIADNIRSYTGGTESLTLDGMAEGVKEVYKAGQESGGGGNYDEGYEAGQRAEYDRFWDNYQNNGNRRDYECAFSGTGWKTETLLPKYDIISPSSAYMMFRTCGYTGDLDDVFENRGLTLDLSGCKNFQYLFYNTSITAVGTIDCSSATEGYIPSIFNSPNLVTIRNLIPPKIAMSTTCWSSGLVNLGIGGEIVADFNVSRCTKLTHDSLMSIINALKDFRTIVTKTYDNVDYIWDAAGNDGYKNQVITIDRANGGDTWIEEQGSGYGVYYIADGSAWPVVLSVHFEVSLTEAEEIAKAETFMLDDNNNLTITIKQPPTETGTLTLGATNLAKLSDEEKAIATQKGWTIEEYEEI